MPNPLYELEYIFFIYSFLGWLMESTINSVKAKSFVNRGFFIGPYCPIYGVGMSLLYLFCQPLQGHFLLIFIVGMAFTTFLEYATGTIMEKLFHATWWDYSHKKCNLHGRICLQVSLCWGLLSVVFINIIQPLITDIIFWIPRLQGIIILTSLKVIFVADAIYSFYIALKFSSKLPALIDLRSEVVERLEQTKLYGLADELKISLELKLSSSKFTRILEQVKLQVSNSSDRSLQEFYHGLTDKWARYNAQLKPFTFWEKRILKAFPHLSLEPFKALKQKMIRKEQKDDSLSK